MFKLVGILLILNALAITACWVMGEHAHKGWAFTICLAAIFTGAFMVLQERVIEFTVKGIGTIKSAAERASADANEISSLKNRMEAQSATIDLVAKQATKAKELSEEVARKNVRAEEKLVEIDNTLSEAKESLKSLESYSKYYAVVIAAQGEDRIAYDQLGKLAADNSFPFRVHAQQTYQKIRDDHSQGMYDSHFTINWKEGVDPNKLTFEQLKQQFLSANQDPYLRRALLEYIWQRNDIPKILRLDFMADVIRTDKHLMVCEYAGRYFIQGVELKIKPLALDYLIKWWADNRGKFEEKPDPNK